MYLNIDPTLFQCKIFVSQKKLSNFVGQLVYKKLQSQVIRHFTHHLHHSHQDGSSASFLA